MPSVSIWDPQQRFPHFVENCLPDAPSVYLESELTGDFLLLCDCKKFVEMISQKNMPFEVLGWESAVS